MNTPSNDRKGVRAALLGIFPSRKPFLDFQEDDPAVARRAVPLFVRYARTKGFIQEDEKVDPAIIVWKEREQWDRAKNC